MADDQQEQEQDPNKMPDGSQSDGPEDIDSSFDGGPGDAGTSGEEQIIDPQALPEPEKTEEEKEGDRRARVVQERINKPARKLDETIPGGKVMSRSGNLHNSFGQRIDEAGNTLSDRPEVREPPPGRVRKLV